MNVKPSLEEGVAVAMSFDRATSNVGSLSVVTASISV